MEFFQVLQQRNRWLHLLGCLLFVAGIICLGFLLFDNRQQDGMSLWNFPFKYALGSGIYVFTIGWLSFLINNTSVRNWITFFLFLIISGFSSIILIQLIKGKILLYTNNSPFDHLLNQMAGLLYFLFLILQLAITVVFFRQKKNMSSQHYTWGVRMAMIIFTVFHFLVLGLFLLIFQDFSLLLEWIQKDKLMGYDIQLSLYLGIHAIQIIPVLSYYLFESKKQVVFFASIYLGLIVVFLLSFFLSTH